MSKITQARLSTVNLLNFISVPVCTIFLTVGILSILVSACDSAYSVAGEIISLLTKFEFDHYERQYAGHSIFAEFTTQIIQQPIEFTVAGFYCITKTFLSSVKKKQKKKKAFKF